MGCAQSGCKSVVSVGSPFFLALDGDLVNKNPVACNAAIRCLTEHRPTDCGHSDQHLAPSCFPQNPDKKATLDLAHPDTFPVICAADLKYADLLVHPEARRSRESAHVVEPIERMFGDD